MNMPHKAAVAMDNSGREHWKQHELHTTKSFHLSVKGAGVHVNSRESLVEGRS